MTKLVISGNIKHHINVRKQASSSSTAACNFRKHVHKAAIMHTHKSYHISVSHFAASSENAHIDMWPKTRALGVPHFSAFIECGDTRDRPTSPHKIPICN